MCQLKLESLMGRTSIVKVDETFESKVDFIKLDKVLGT